MLLQGTQPIFEAFPPARCDDICTTGGDLRSSRLEPRFQNCSSTYFETSGCEDLQGQKGSKTAEISSEHLAAVPSLRREFPIHSNRA